MLPDNFLWIIPQKLAGSSSPSISELMSLKEAGINGIVSLQTHSGGYDMMHYTPDDLSSLGIDFIHIPMDDFTGAEDEQFDEFISFVNRSPKASTSVHCYLGIGRTGTMIAAYLGRIQELTGQQAIDAVRAFSIRYIQTNDQEKSLISYLG